MPTFMLQGSTAVNFPARAITVSVRAEGTTAVRLVALSGGSELVGTVAPRPDLLIIPAVADQVVVRLLPIGATRFDESTVVHVSASVPGDDPGAEASRAVLDPVSLAGLDARDVLILDADAGLIRIRGVRVAAKLRLSALGMTARVATRELLGVESVDDISALDVRVAIDESASFRTRVLDRNLADVLDMFAGILAVIAPDRRVGGATVGEGVHPVTVAGLESLSETLVQALADRRPSSGFRSGHRDLRGFSPDGNAMTYVITDAVPADVADLERADRIPGEARHLVVLGEDSAWQVQVPPTSPSTLIPIVPGGPSLAERCLSDPALLPRLIRSVLVGCFPPGTSAHERVSR